MVLSTQARLFVVVIVALGIATVTNGVAQWHVDDGARFLCYLGIALFASSLKVKLPGITSTMSVHFLFVLVGIIELSFPETMVIGGGATLIQAIVRTKSRPKLIQTLFNVSAMCVAITLTARAYQLVPTRGMEIDPLLVAAVACTFFLANSVPIAAIISLVEKKSMRKMWKECYFWSFPYYLVGAGIGEILHLANHYFGWHTAVCILPVVYIIFRSYRLYLGKLDREKVHAEQVAALHLRTIEALSLAIDAKDH